MATSDVIGIIADAFLRRNITASTVPATLLLRDYLERNGMNPVLHRGRADAVRIKLYLKDHMWVTVGDDVYDVELEIIRRRSFILRGLDVTYTDTPMDAPVVNDEPYILRRNNSACLLRIYLDNPSAFWDGRPPKLLEVKKEIDALLMELLMN